MSAPDTNINRQTKRHKPSLAGILAAAMLAVGVLLVVAFWPGPLAEDAELPATTVEIEQ